MEAKYSVPYVSGPTQAECHPEPAKDPRPKRSRRRGAVLRLRSQARFAQDDTAVGDGVRTFRNPLRSYGQRSGLATPASRGCGLATDQKAVRRRGPGRVVLGSKPQLATTKENS